MQLPALLRPAAGVRKKCSSKFVVVPIRPLGGRRRWIIAAQNAGGDSVTIALRELAKCWEARLAKVEIDKALRKFYRVNVRFPDHLDEVQTDIPESLRLDSWGQPWIYKTAAPEEFREARRPALRTWPDSLSAALHAGNRRQGRAGRAGVENCPARSGGWPRALKFATP